MKRVLLIIFILSLTIAGCTGKKEIKLSEEALIAQKAIQNVEAIKDSYVRKDRQEIGDQVEESLSDEILASLTFDTADLSFTVRLVKISTSQVMVHLNWHGTWWRKGLETVGSGVGIMVFNKDSMKLSQIDGDSPFLYSE